MIINLIVSLVLLFALVFLLVWFVRRDLREQIEQPKHQFQAQLKNYDQHCHHNDTSKPA